MATEPNTGLTFQEANSLQTDALQNELVNYLGVWLNCAVQSIGDTTPPTSPANGDRYIVGASATGAWATHDDELAILRGGTWQFHAPPAAGVPIIKNLADNSDWECVAGVWAEKAGGIAEAPIDGQEYVRKNAAWAVATGDSGGGAMEKLAEVVVTGSAVTDIDFSGLDLDADGIYQIEMFVKPGATGQHLVAMYYSGDTTNANYYSQLGYFLSATPGAGASAAPYIFFNNTLSNTTNPYSFTAKLMKISGEKPTAISIGQGVNTTTGFPFFSSYAHRRDNTGNVISIKLRNTITNGFGVGTIVRLYRLN